MDKYTAIVVLASVIGGTLMLSVLFQTIGSVIVSRQRSPVREGQLARLDERLSRMEQAIDAMAVEVERISEAQRFTTRLLAEKAAPGEQAMQLSRGRPEEEPGNPGSASSA